MENKFLLLDGGMGTMLQAAGLKTGEKPEVFGMEHPEILEKIQRKYVESGSNVIYANTFGANRLKLAGSGHSVAELVAANIRIARKAADAGMARVALDIGPCGQLVEPLGTLSFEDAYDIYKEIVVAGAEAGADLIVFETFTDLYEVKAAVLAAKENSDLPVWVTMSFEASGRTFTGTTVASMAITLTGLGVDALGINCSLGPAEILPLIREMKEWTDLPILVKPNAGLPDPKTGEYQIDADEFGRQMAAYPELGIYAMGGCCGTTPEFIAALDQLRESDHASPINDDADNGAQVPHGAGSSCAPVSQGAGSSAVPSAVRKGVCSASRVAELDGKVRVIGERINPTGKKRFQQALREHDMNYIMERAIEQEEAGAEILDINVGLPNSDEAALMTEVVKAVQSVVDLPLQIDSSNVEAIEAGLRAVNGRAILNSVNGEAAKLEAILPLVKKYGAAVVGLAMDERGLPQNAKERFEIAERIVDKAAEYGIPREDVIIDCLTLTVSAQQDQARETLQAVQMVHDQLGCHQVLGVSNISFGLPSRVHVTESFLTQALYCGLDLPIVNPNTERIMDVIASYRALSGEDPDCEAYIRRFADEVSENKSPVREGSVPEIEHAILKGLKDETARITGELLESMSEMEVINQKLIPALDRVGEEYEKERIFLPQLINAANAACAGFDLIKARIAERGADSVSKGKIIVATVEGDIHDIGKNIARVVLENYGYQVIDLGRDVKVETVVETCEREEVRMVGLSALMTTTVENMKRTVELIHQRCPECQVMVAGAVLTENYAREIGADHYAKDAKAAADIAKDIFREL